MAGSIICGVDGSPESRAALRVAAQFADERGSTLILAHVAEPARVPHAAGYADAAGFGEMGGPITMAEETESGEEAARRLLDRVAFDAGLEGAERRIAIGHPAERLADLADEEDADLIVVGSRGRGALKAAFLGSVSSGLVGVARCPVVIVPPGASEER
jgi:nucleotide-binding universal stress UspA family protein